MFGHRKVLFWALIIEVGFTFITFFASDITVLCVGQVLMGIPWGIFATCELNEVYHKALIIQRLHIDTFISQLLQHLHLRFSRWSSASILQALPICAFALVS